VRHAIVVTVVLLGVAGVLAVPGAGATGTHTAGPNATVDQPTIVAAYPNPVTDGDAGEFVVLSVPDERSLSAYTLGDDETTATLPNVSAAGRVVLTGDPAAVPDTVEGRVVEVSGFPALANTGEPLTLAAGNRTLDTLTYVDASTDELTDGEAWRPLSGTDRDPVGGGPTTVEAFVLPDAPDAAVEAIRGAEERLLLAGYTFASERVADALVAAEERGAAVEVLLDGGPVGGFTNRSVTILDRLVDNGVTVSMLAGQTAPYRFHHPKYAVADDKAVVLTENWKPAGVGGHSSRGWGMTTTQPAVVEGLVRTFRADATNRSTVPWERHREGVSVENATPASGRYPSRFDPATLDADRVELLVAPDNAVERIESLLANASDSIRILQVSVDGPENRLLRAAIAAARRGVDVDLLLSRAWYAAEENRALAANLTATAEQSGVPLSVRLADPNGRYEKVHAKGLVVDGEHVVLGSLNWNDNAFENNREVVLLVSGEAVGAYYGRVFAADWEGGARRLQLGLVVMLLVVVAVAAAVGRKIQFRP
jgi:phosphatidylserine/phosphatidylglycerophosphate/cardiolipin synthase-like enzyme